jgi:hypothetical protein
VSRRARGSAEKIGRRRSAIEGTDIKVSICCERRELRVGYGYLFAASSIVILWYKTSVTEIDVTMIFICTSTSSGDLKRYRSTTSRCSDSNSVSHYPPNAFENKGPECASNAVLFIISSLV